MTRLAVSYLTGTRQLKRPLYCIRQVSERHWWWGTRETFTIQSEFMSLGGFETRADALTAISACGGVYSGDASNG